MASFIVQKMVPPEGVDGSQLVSTVIRADDRSEARMVGSDILGCRPEDVIVTEVG